MGIKRKVSQTYVTDRGIEMEVSEMTPSHLVNAIAHHQRQVEALEKVSKLWNTNYMERRIKQLYETIETLASELSQRDPQMDYEQERDQRSRRDSWQGDYE